MPPEIVGYDPFSKVHQIEQSGQDVAGIIGQAKQAEMALQKQKLAQKGAMYLHDVINKRIEETGNPDIGFAPFIDPVVNRAASMVEPISRDYVELMKGIHDRNAKMLEPKNVPGGYIKYAPEKDAQGKIVTDARGLPKYSNQFTQTEPPDIQVDKTVINKGGIPVVMRSYVDKNGLTVKKTEIVGETMSPSGGSGSPTVMLKGNELKGKFAEIMNTINEFENNPKLKSKYEEIISSPEYADAVNSGDIDMVSQIISRLTGDTTPEKVNTKLFFNYINAKTEEPNVRTRLKDLNIDVSSLEPKPKAAKPVKKGKGFNR